ncbi:MAG: hypothetical protein ACXWLI_11725, partial [Myxococcaceae bacterium]
MAAGLGHPDLELVQEHTADERCDSLPRLPGERQVGDRLAADRRQQPGDVVRVVAHRSSDGWLRVRGPLVSHDYPLPARGGVETSRGCDVVGAVLGSLSMSDSLEPDTDFAGVQDGFERLWTP